MENLGNSFYNGLQVTLTQRAFNGLNFLAGYTWAHALDNATTNRTGYPAGQPHLSTGVGKWRLRYPPPLHVFHELRTAQPARPAADGQGWQLTSIVNLQTGEPYNFYDSSNDISYSGEFLDRWDFSGNPNDVHWTNDANKQITYLEGSDATSNPRCAAQSRNPDLDF